MTIVPRVKIATLCAPLCALVLVAGCDRIGNPFQALNTKQKGPDEFSVIARAPLTMPPTRELPEPTPGTRSPLDPDPQRDAITALTGRGDSFARTSSAGTSSGEEVLLSSANAAAASSEIRVQLEEDRVRAEENKPYEPPTIIELLSGEKDEINREEVLDPDAESRRLQTAGVTAPVNPFEQPPEEPRAGSEPDPTSYGENSGGRRPNNKLPSSN